MLAWLENRPDRHLLLGVMAISLSLKLILVGIDPVIKPDGALYIAAARHFADGDLGAGLTLYPMPAYSLLLALVHALLPDWIAAARVIGISATVLSTVPLWGISRRLFNSQAAFWATLCLALTPEVNEIALNVLRDPAFLFLVLSAIWLFVWGWSERRIACILMALLMAGAAFSFRVEGIVLLVMPILFLGLKALLNKTHDQKRFAWRSLLVWLAVPLAVVLFFFILMGPKFLGEHRLGELTKEARQILELEAFDQYQEIYDFFREIEAKAPFSGFSKSLPAIVRHWMPLIYLIGLMEYFIKQVFPLFLIPLFWSAGRFLSKPPRRFAGEKQIVLLIWCGYMAFLLYSFMVRDFMVGRFLLPPAILLYPWIGEGFTFMMARIERYRLAPVALTVLLLIFLGTPGVKSVQNAVEAEGDFAQVANYIAKSQKLAGAKILYNDYRHGLYAERDYIPEGNSDLGKEISRKLEKGRISEIETLMLEERADALVLSVNLSKLQEIPQFEHYTADKKFPNSKGFTIIYVKK